METNPLDSATITELRDVMGDQFGLLCKRFADDAARRVVVMRDAIEQRVSQTLRSEAHSLKGASANLGAAALANHCLTMEQWAKEENWSSASACLGDIEQSLKAVVAALAGLTGC